MIYKNITDLIGATPIISFENLFIKLEGFNASGSVKDRAAKWMLEGLEKRGILKSGMTIVEPTSGNTGISLAMIGAAKGYNVVLVMPDTMSLERRQLMIAYGATIILTEGSQGMKGSIAEANRLVIENGYIMPSQFINEDNPLSHEQSTALEIIKDFNELDYFVCGIGTGGTITGAAKILKKHFPNLKVIGVEPKESPIISQGYSGPHGIQGIGAGFLPDILDLTLIDEIRTIDTLSTKKEANRLAKKGLLLGISSAAAILVGRAIINENPLRKVLVIAPDGGMKYLSTNIYN
ncbi:MAG: PLP-dependent cysteine synthase family protein [Bacilli bacterium]